AVPAPRCPTPTPTPTPTAGASTVDSSAVSGPASLAVATMAVSGPASLAVATMAVSCSPAGSHGAGPVRSSSVSCHSGPPAAPLRRSANARLIVELCTPKPAAYLHIGHTLVVPGHGVGELPFGQLARPARGPHQPGRPLPHGPLMQRGHIGLSEPER